MPVKIKQKQTKKTQWVNYDYYFHNIKGNDLYISLIFKDLYELYNRISGVEIWQATLEKKEAITARNKHPNIFRIEKSKLNTHFNLFLFLFEYMPVNIAEAILDTTKSHAGTRAVKILSNIIKYFLIPIIVGFIILLIWFFVHPLLSNIYHHD